MVSFRRDPRRWSSLCHGRFQRRCLRQQVRPLHTLPRLLLTLLSIGINNPTYEIWPRADGETVMDSPLLAGTLPANQYPITHLLPSGEILVNVNHNASLLNYHTGA